MSKFVTSLAVDLAQLTAALPRRAYVHTLVWNPIESRLECTWEDDTLETGLTIPVEFVLVDLQRRLLPKGTHLHKGAVLPQSTSQQKTPEPAAGAPAPGAANAKPAARPSKRTKAPHHRARPGA